MGTNNTGTEVRERCMADDTMVWAEGVANVERLFEIIKEFEEASGQELNEGKSKGVRFGTEKGKTVPGSAERIEWRDYGKEEIEVSLGILVT